MDNVLTITNALLMQEFDASTWIPIIMILVGPSLAMIAIWFVLAGFMPRRAEAAKENLPTIFFGVFLLSVAGAMVTALTSTVGSAPETLILLQVM